MVPRARGTMDMGVGYNGHVYRHVGGTSCVNQHILIVKRKIKKVIFNCRNIHFKDSEILKVYILWGWGTMGIKINNGAPWTCPWCPVACSLYPVHGAPA